MDLQYLGLALALHEQCQLQLFFDRLQLVLILVALQGLVLKFVLFDDLIFPIRCFHARASISLVVIGAACTGAGSHRVDFVGDGTALQIAPN